MCTKSRSSLLNFDKSLLILDLFFFCCSDKLVESIFNNFKSIEVIWRKVGGEGGGVGRVVVGSGGGGGG